ncbi:hypothetical protein [Larkinella sp. C7]|uniref:hypothetical protein n=1 Tax=Larkinella sp. C7 TaxID=2576607 RepID=UPI001111595E|nr:hypothetical protein [Larkinella sp. C7]
MKKVILELSARDAEVIEKLLEMSSEELRYRKFIRQSAGISLGELQHVDKVRKRITTQLHKS